MNEEYLLQIALELRDEASRNIAQANQEMERMKAQMKSLEEGAKKTSDSMKVSFEKVAKASKVMLAGITGVAVASVKTYADMEKGIKKVETVSSKSFEQIKSSATELATTYGISISEVLQGNYDMVSSMGDIAQSQEVLSTAAKLSVAGFTSFGGAINALSSVMNAYKMEASEATKVSDMLMQVQNRGVVDINELQAVLSSVVPAAAAMKIEFKDVAAAIATMTSNKIPAAQATTQLKAAFAELAKEGTTVSKNFKEITGVSFQTFIAQGGTVAEAFDLIARGAETSGKSLFDVFGSIDAAGAVINLTGANADKFSNNLKGMEEAAGTTQKGFEKMSESFSFQIEVLKERALVGARSIGEQLTPKVRELVEWISKIDWKVAFSQENINSAITWGKTIAGIAGTLWAIEKALWAAKVAQTAWNIACLANPYIVAGLAIVGVVGGVTTALVKGANDAKKVANDSAEAQIAALERVKASMAKGGTGASELDFVNGFTELKDVLNSGDIQKGIAQVDKELKKLKGVKIQLTPEEEMEYLNKGYATTLKKNSVNKSPVITPNFGGGSGGGTGGGLGGSVASSARETAASWVAEFQKELELMPKIWEHLGLSNEDEKQMEEKVRFLESAIKTAATKGFDSAIPGIKKTLEETKLKLGIFAEDREYDNNAKVDYEANQKRMEDEVKALEEQKKIEVKASEDAVNALKGMGQSLYQAADLLKSEFMSSLAGVVNGISSMMSSFSTMSKSLGQMGGGLAGLGGLGNLLPAGLMSGLSGGMSFISGAMGMAGAAAGIAQTVATSLFGGKTSADIAKKNEEQKALYEKNTDAIKQLGEVILANTKRLEDFSMTLIANISKAPTLSRIDSGKFVYDAMAKAMMGDKNFGQVSALKKGSKRNWYGKKKTTYSNVGISEDRLQSLAGVERKNIDNMNLGELIKYRSGLNNVNNSMLGSNITSSNFNDYKKNLDSFIKQVEMLNKEQDELFRSATLENFEGVDFLEEKQLIKEYTDMFKDLGVDVNKYAGTIKEMAEANQVLITAMDDVRQSMIENIVSGEGGFASSMTSYFKKIMNNMASVIYDVNFSKVDQQLNTAFKNISERLVDIKKKGGDMLGSMTGLVNMIDFSAIMDANKIDVEFESLIDSIREKFKKMGMSDDIINSFLPETELSKKLTEKIQTIKQSLSNAMKSALDVMDFEVFNKSIGQSLYENVKSGLIQAFTETELYKGLMNKFMPDVDKMLSGATNFEGAFNIMKDYLEKFEKELEAGGMGFESNTKTESDEDKTLGNSFYKDSGSSISIHIEQNFDGNFVGDYDFRKLARDGAIDALKESNEQVKLVAGF